MAAAFRGTKRAEKAGRHSGRNDPPRFFLRVDAPALRRFIEGSIQPKASTLPSKCWVRTKGWEETLRWTGSGGGLRAWAPVAGIGVEDPPFAKSAKDGAPAKSGLRRVVLVSARRSHIQRGWSSRTEFARRCVGCHLPFAKSAKDRAPAKPELQNQNCKTGTAKPELQNRILVFIPDRLAIARNFLRVRRRRRIRRLAGAGGAAWPRLRVRAGLVCGRAGRDRGACGVRGF